VHGIYSFRRNPVWELVGIKYCNEATVAKTIYNSIIRIPPSKKIRIIIGKKLLAMPTNNAN